MKKKKLPTERPERPRSPKPTRNDDNPDQPAPRQRIDDTPDPDNDAVRGGRYETPPPGRLPTGQDEF
jgi:hypothetical protein